MVENTDLPTLGLEAATDRYSIFIFSILLLPFGRPQFA